MKFVQSIGNAREFCAAAREGGIFYAFDQGLRVTITHTAIFLDDVSAAFLPGYTCPRFRLAELHDGDDSVSAFLTSHGYDLRCAYEALLQRMPVNGSSIIEGMAVMRQDLVELWEDNSGSRRTG
ncbi:hypothetical protein CAI21_22590 [Alkalilimnicola ehrlichii]|uniref:Uncharacterized protein n=1 Tax=Alkalilimnicola ehrlichii TaxID=351052 RepID=A0A3E0WH13_9GAMM|nr:hypothetical protein [Alkalilimnicola ehrlichii]RFA24165.1 hypothetical protein CAI21_22590 [Alkalilimnicola ehrlichii]RFA30410.1 hypothetical protein CAL65_22725 [Alkalilimnicola ehrlichii]